MDELARAPKQLEFLLSFLHFSKTEGEVSQANLLKKSGANAAQLKGLVDKNILFIEKRNIDRLPSLPRKMDVQFSIERITAKSTLEIDKGI